LFSYAFAHVGMHRSAYPCWTLPGLSVVMGMQSGPTLEAEMGK
jgi:hypothetical protein